MIRYIAIVSFLFTQRTPLLFQPFIFRFRLQDPRADAKTRHTYQFWVKHQERCTIVSLGRQRRGSALRHYQRRDSPTPKALFIPAWGEAPGTAYKRLSGVPTARLIGRGAEPRLLVHVLTPKHSNKRALLKPPIRAILRRNQ
jgi:hypothetical protein